MIDEESAVEAVAAMVTLYHETRDREGIDAPATEWMRAEISGARTLLEATVGESVRSRVFEQVRQQTGKGIPHRDREWIGWDSEAQRER
jgi:hypothetical protein